MGVKAVPGPWRRFAPGQVYVALSRCKTLEGLVLASRIDEKAIINDRRVADYIARQENEAERSESTGIVADARKLCNKPSVCPTSCVAT